MNRLDPISPATRPAPWPDGHAACRRDGCFHFRPVQRVCPEAARPVAFDEFLRSNNAALARAGLDGPVPYSRWIERVNREDATVRAPERAPSDGGRPVLTVQPRPAGISWASPPTLGDVPPGAVRRVVESVRHAYTVPTMLPRGMTMDVLA